MKSHSTPMVAMALVFGAMVASCGGGAPENPLEGSEWTLVSIQEGADTFLAPSAADTPGLGLTGEVVQDRVRRRLTGSGGCNFLSGSYIAAPEGTLRLGALARTRKACPADVMDFETRFTRVLADVTHFTLEGSRLSMASEGSTLTFERVSLPE